MSERQAHLLARARALPEVGLLGMATEVPRHVLHQEAVLERARKLFAGSVADFERLVPIYGNAGIATRHSCVPLEWYERDTGWRERNALYLESALALIENATRRCLAEAGLDAEAVDVIVTVSSTGIATPSLDARLMQRLPFRRDVERLPIFGLGCAGGVIGLARAGALARARPGARVLLLVVELCGLTFRRGDSSKSNVVATALFGDGAAAVLIASGGGDRGPRLGASGEYTWPDSLDVMGWRVEENGFGVLFSRDIPSLIRRDFAAALDAFLARHGLARQDLDGLACHPGGTKVLTALEEIFGLPEGGMTAARDVLRRYGNMSAATVLFVLERVLAEGARGRILLCALGPGFTAGFNLIDA